jgi:hypothetical protein
MLSKRYEDERVPTFAQRWQEYRCADETAENRCASLPSIFGCSVAEKEMDDEDDDARFKSELVRLLLLYGLFLFHLLI